MYYIGPMPGYDFIIVGGGSAGSVLASRLSARSANRVLLLEAGRDILPGHEPTEILDTFYMAPYHTENLWPDTRVHWSAVRPGQPEPEPAFYEQARVIGGGSSINAMVAIRGAPDDFAQWQSLGATGWSWEDVLPYYRRLERDLDFGGDLHGSDGPIPIRRHRRDQWPPLVRAMAANFEHAGYRHIEDVNASFEDGFCTLPMSSLPAHRVSAAIGYLDAATRRRANLEILGDHQVDTLHFDGKRVTGVSAVSAAGRRDFSARQVIVSAGGLRSPALLLRNGIGPPDALRELGLTVRSALPGVGRNLLDHPSVFVAAHLRRGSVQDPRLRPNTNCALLYSSGIDGCPSRDMFLTVLNKITWHPLGRRLGGFAVCLHKPFSTGTVSLQSTDPALAPHIAFNALADPRDLARVKAGVLLITGLLRAPEVAGLINETFAASFSARIQRLNRRTRLNWLASAVANVLLDGPAVVRTQLFRHLIRVGPRLESLVADEAALETWINANVTGFFHPCGTCRMGAPGDPATVVDCNANVQGVEGLRVVDASIMPAPIRAPTNITTLMMAEKIAAHLLG